MYNATSLTQVFADYFRDYSIGDNGGINVEDSDYVAKAGYPGTLAPGNLNHIFNIIQFKLLTLFYNR